MQIRGLSRIISDNGPTSHNPFEMVPMSKNPLGQQVLYPATYSPELLYPIERQSYREGISGEIGIPNGKVPLGVGFDRWMCYELSWLHDSRPPGVGLVEIVVPASSPAIVESKSLKLYLNSFAQSSFSSFEQVCETIAQDISRAIKNDVSVVIFPPDRWQEIAPTPHAEFLQWAGSCIDTIPIPCKFTEPDRSILTVTRGERVSERLYSHLLRTLCPVTQQPDWATVQISYTGAPISHGSLLQYLVSFRNHLGFHEACCERIVADIALACTPERLSVSCLFTRRGGIDITPVRSFGDGDDAVSRVRVPRQ